LGTSLSVATAAEDLKQRLTDTWSGMQQLTSGKNGSRLVRNLTEGISNTYCSGLNCSVSALTSFSTHVIFV